MRPPRVSEEETRELRFALDASKMTPHLLALIRERDPSHASAERVICQITDAKYDPGRGCAILYRCGKHIVLGRLRWNREADAPVHQSPGAPPGLELTLFPEDPALPNLPDALDSHTMSAALSTVLRECREGWRIAQCNTTPVRYRPSRRCTLRIDLWLREPHTGSLTARTLYGKVYHDAAKATSVFSEMQQLAAATELHPQGLSVAAPAGFLSDIPMVLQEPVSGTPLIEYFGRPTPEAPHDDLRARRGVEQAARALAELQHLGVQSERKRPAAEELKKMTRRARGTAMVDPELGSRMERLADALGERLNEIDSPEAATGLVHGDCKPDQFLMDGTVTTILDFDHCGTADPATDVATFLATLRQLRIKHSIKSPRHARAVADSGWLADAHTAFLQTYGEARAEVEDFRRRVVWYEAQALLRKAQRAFARSIRSPMPGALISEAEGCLQSPALREVGAR